MTAFLSFYTYNYVDIEFLFTFQECNFTKYDLKELSAVCKCLLEWNLVIFETE